MSLYDDYNDYELLYLVSESNEDANDIIYKKYRPVVEMKARKTYKNVSSLGLDLNDLIQEGMIGLSEAIRDYKEQKDVKFITFANLCIDRQINSAILMANRQKHKFLNNSISIDTTVNDSEKTLIDFLFDDSKLNPEEFLLEEESQKELIDLIKLKLSSAEAKVFDLKIQGFTYKEIANILNKTPKSVDSSLQRIRLKTSKILEEKSVQESR